MKRYTTPVPRLREVRKAAGLTLDRVASLVGTTAATVSRIERRRIGMTFAAASRLAEALGVDWWALFEPHPGVEEIQRAGLALAELVEELGAAKGDARADAALQRWARANGRYSLGMIPPERCTGAGSRHSTGEAA